MDWLFDRLDRAEAADRRRLEDLRGRLVELQEQVRQVEDRLARFAITRETALALQRREWSADGSDGRPDGSAPGPDAGPDAGPGAGSDAGSDAGSGMGEGPSERRKLSGVTERAVVLLAGAGRPMRAKEITAALGEPTAPGRVEGMRTRLKRLVATGWLVEDQPGLFAIAAGVDARVGHAAVNGVAVQGGGR